MLALEWGNLYCWRVASSRNDRKKRRGVFYTPQRLSEVLTAWAVRTAQDTVLEPGFGECAFLDAIADRLTKLEANEPSRLVYGCDIQKRALRSVPAILRSEASADHFVHADFLQLTPKSFEVDAFDVAIGNPPYVSRHNMYGTQLSAALAVGEDSRFRLPHTASLWAYFVFHTLRFLRPGGRMAWVLPSSAIGADYARKLFKELCARFERVTVVSVRERVFLAEGAEESSELLLCENFGSTNSASEVKYHDCSDIGGCAELLKQIRFSPRESASENTSPMLARVSATEKCAWERWLCDPAITNLGSLSSRIAIGVVTGDNTFFVVSESEIAKRNLPKDAFRPIFAKFAHARGLNLLAMDIEAMRSANHRCLLLHVKDELLGNSEILQYCENWPSEARKKNVTFGKRPCWLRPDDEQIPDAFLTYMNHDGPRIVLNKTRTNSTNTIHRLWFASPVDDVRRRMVAVSLLSTFSQLGAELTGRTYGGGVLKHELKDASAIPLVCPEHAPARQVNKAFNLVNKLWRRNELDAARKIADEFVTTLVSLNPASDLPLFRDLLSRLRERRWRKGAIDKP